MQYDRLTKGVAAVFAVLTAVLTVVGLLTNPAVLFLALMFGLSTYFMYYHLSGKMAADLYERVERRAAQNPDGARRGGFGAGPREEWRPPRDGRRARETRRVQQERTRRRRTRTASRNRQRGQPAQPSNGPSPSEAYRRLGLQPNADERAIKQAYREKVKEVHPDTDTGSEAEFKQVKAAYETLTGD